MNRLLLSAFISIIITFTFNIIQIDASFCTLCEGTTSIPYPDDIAVGSQTCLDLAMTAVFHDENDKLCTRFREVAKVPCSCLTTKKPTGVPTRVPTVKPTVSPTKTQTAKPTVSPTSGPAALPTVKLTVSPTANPTVSLTASPTVSPTVSPTSNLTTNPTTTAPTSSPTSSTGRGNQCSLCPNNNLVPDKYQNKKITSDTEQTCLDLEKEVKIHLESSTACTNLFQPMGIKYCGCSEEEEESSPSSPSSSTKTLSPTSAPTSTSQPSSIIDKEPNCDDLLSGRYPIIPTDNDNVLYKFFDYNAEVFLNSDTNVLDEKMMKGLEQRASQIVSATAAGCYNNRPRNNRRLYDDATTNDLYHDGRKVHYVKFTMMDDTPEVPCETTVLFESSSCHTVSGKIGILYSVMDPSINDDDDKYAVWAQTMVKNLVRHQSNVIVSYINAINHFRISNMRSNRETTFSELEVTDDNIEEKTSDSLLPGILIFVAVAIVAVLIFIAFVGIQRRRSRRLRQHNSRRRTKDRGTMIVANDSSGGEDDPSSSDDSAWNSFPLQIEESQDYDEIDDEDLTNRTPLDQGVEMELLERRLTRKPKKSFSFEKHRSSHVEYDDTVEL